jgi:hypothetical protein
LPGSTFWQQFEKASPQILGAVLDGVVTALKNESETRESILREGLSLPRMADAAIWVEAASSAFRWDSGDYLSAFIANQTEIQRHITHAEIVATAIHRLMESREVWEGNSTDLLEALKVTTPDDVQRVKAWPKAANSLSGKLRRAAPGLRMTGIEVSERTLDGKTIWTLTKNKPEKDPTDPTDLTSEAKWDKGDKWDVSRPKSFENGSETYEREERLAIQDEPARDPKLPKTLEDR